MLPIAKCLLSAISEFPGLALQIRTDALQKGQKREVFLTRKIHLVTLKMYFCFSSGTIRKPTCAINALSIFCQNAGLQYAVKHLFLSTMVHNALYKKVLQKL